jgi:sugar phosphate isomerase/epimerase
MMGLRRVRLPAPSVAAAALRKAGGGECSMIGRRAFLAGSILASAAARVARADGGMYVSLNGSLTPGKIAWPDFARLAARVGYGGVDVNLPAAMREGLDATRALFAEIKIRPAYSSLPVTATRDEEAFRTSFARFDEAARFAAAINCPRMVTVIPPASDTPKDEYRRILKTRFTAIGEILARHDIRVGFEFLGPLHFRTGRPHEFIWRMNDMLAFAKECGPNFGLLLDVWHWHHAGATTADIIKAGKNAIVAVHLSDCAAMAPEEVRDNRRLLAGEGVIDLPGFFKALRQIGYEGSVSPEPLGRIPADASPEEGARLGLESARRYVQ